MPRPTDLHDHLADLLDDILAWEVGMPVRAMEEVLAMGPYAVPAVLDALREWEEDSEDRATLWLLVLLGRSGDARAVEPLLEWLAKDEVPRAFRSAAVDGLARMADAALPALVERLEDADQEERLWIYAALGAMGVEAAHDRLVEALEHDPELAEVVATALAEWRRPDDVPRILEALRRSEPWQRPELEEAIQLIHHDRDGTWRDQEEDWRLRYRIHPGFGTVEPSWVVVASILREVRTTGELPEPEVPPVRSLEEIVADRPVEEEGLEFCEECGEPVEYPTGLPVCPETALGVVLKQHRALGHAREEGGFEDLFDLLDALEEEEEDLRAMGEPRGRRAREERRRDLEEMTILRATCRWLVGEGIEHVGAARTRLLAEAARLRALHGDPDGLLQPMRMPDRRGPEPGRNEACPCGSGRKYKTCHGAPGTAGADLPNLETREGDPFVFGRAHYRVADGPEVRRRLLADPAFDADDPGGAIVWLRPVDEDERQLLGTIRIEGDRLVLECVSMERLRRGRALIERLAADLVTHRSDTAQDPWRAAAESADRGAPDPEPDLPVDVQRALIEKVMDRHYRTWPDEPVPALGGRTPREAVKTEAGRQATAALLQAFEDAPISGPDQAVPYDFGWLWEELGIADLRE